MGENSWSWILWIVIILMAAINTITSKRRKAAKQNMPAANDAPREPFETVLTRFFGEAADNPHYSSMTNEGSIQSPADSEPVNYGSKSTRLSSSKIRNNSATASTASSLSTTSKPENKRNAQDSLSIAQQTGNDNPAIDFDLREAVVYSEILKPKFDE